ncbi:hypothetical protein [Ensifer soli]|uniref:hypothetical protein n=1 Tax=Ciceribacter sp. sgz301302 TaxID=3342379 RepID=UPI0035B9623C
MLDLDVLPESWPFSQASYGFITRTVALFVTQARLADARAKLPELVPEELVAPLRQAEAKRVFYVSEGHLDGP